MNIQFNRPTHSGKLERWLGTEKVESLSESMANWYGPPIAVAGVPGNVWACKGGDFRGVIGAGKFGSAIDYVADRAKKILQKAIRQSMYTLPAGFASLDALIAAKTAGQSMNWNVQKTGGTGVIGATSSLWGQGPSPPAGANAANAPGGEAPDDSTTGALFFTNPTGGMTLHFVNAFFSCNNATTLLLYDRLFQVNKTMNSTATESVTGVPTRYQSSVTTNPDYAGGNFLFPETGGTALAATAHNWTVCQYRNQAGTDAQTMPSLTGISGCIIKRLDMPLGQWFAPLANGDTGVMDLHQMQCSALVATGVINFVIGHPIAWFPMPLVNHTLPIDGITTAFSLTRIFDDAALAFLEVCRAVTSATNYGGTIHAVYG